MLKRLLLLLCLFFPFSASALVSQLLAGDVPFKSEAELRQIAHALRKAGVNAVTVPLAWALLEPRPSEVSLLPYHASLDLLVEQGLDLLPVIDTSIRDVLDQNIQPLGSAMPKWVLDQRAQQLVGFDGKRLGNLSPFNLEHRKLLRRLYRETLTQLKARYGERVVAVAPGFMQEFEIKLPQFGYVWQGHGPRARKQFTELTGEAEMPVLDRANTLADPYPRHEPRLEPYMRLREQAVAEYACFLANLIREQGLNAMAYFGQSMSSHDAIYALGVIEETVGCFDMITVDYNFYDGWGVELDPRVLPMLANYAHHLGYEKVGVGLYVERLYQGYTLPAKHWKVLPQTLDLLGEVPLHGIEIGNMHQHDLDRLPELTLGEHLPITAPSPKQFKVGIVASKWTFYLWHGERLNDANLIQQALLASYALLQRTPDIEVAVLGERALIEQDLSYYDLLFFPHQTTLSDAARAAVLSYAKQGGKLAQDLRLGAFDTSGVAQHDWLHTHFGIAGLDWRDGTGRFAWNGRRLRLEAQPISYFGHVLLLPQLGYQLGMPSLDEPGLGLALRGPRSVVFGFLPQLDSQWEDIFLAELRALLER